MCIEANCEQHYRSVFRCRIMQPSWSQDNQDSPRERKYSLVRARAGWYETLTQLSFQRELLPAHPELLSGVKVVAMKQNMHLSEIAAHRFSNDTDHLYLCAHNPMTDPHISEMRDCACKYHREVTLVLILPVCESFVVQLESPPPVCLTARRRRHSVTCTADMLWWFPMLHDLRWCKLVVVLPYIEQAMLEASSLWQIVRECTEAEISI